MTVCVGQGATLEARDFSTFCPKAIAGDRPAARYRPASRSIPIGSSRSGSSRETIKQSVRGAHGGGGRRIRRGAGLGSDLLIDQLDTAEPELPDELSDRAQDVWEPLLAIADAAGEGLAEAGARESAIALSGPQESDEATLGVRLWWPICSWYSDHHRAASDSRGPRPASGP